VGVWRKIILGLGPTITRRRDEHANESSGKRRQ